MEYFRLVLLCSFLYVAVVQMGIYASKDVPWDSYWKTALPKTPMPKTLQELLHPDNWIGEKSTYTLNIKTLQGPNIFGKEVYSAGIGKIKVEPDVTTFFFEKDLLLENKIILHSPKTTDAVAAPLLPRKVANSVPFSKSKLPQILSHFALKPNSVEAQAIKQTIQDCEAPSVVGETKYCATSLESLVDFAVSRLGKYAQVYSMEVDNDAKQEYRVAKGIVKKNGDRSVVCHKKKYAYTVFYCHEVQPTRTYTVPLVGADGTKAEAVVICHTDTRTWNSENFALQELKIKPGTEPICHFLTSGNLVWVPNK